MHPELPHQHTVAATHVAAPPTPTPPEAWHPPLWTTSPIFEPQLCAGLGWMLAAGLVAALGPGLQWLPPELALVVGLVAALGVGLRPWLPHVFVARYRELVVDRRRTALYSVAALVFATTAVDGAVGAWSLPHCHQGLWATNTNMAVLVVGLLAIEPLVFRRSLPTEYLWPSSEHGYIARWSIRLVLPIIVLGSGLGVHRIVAGQTWAAGLQGRRMVRTIAQHTQAAETTRFLRDESRRMAEADQRRIAKAAVTHALCHPERLEQLLGGPPEEALEQAEMQRGLRRHALTAYGEERGQ